MVSRMAAGAPQPHARHDLGAVVDEIEHASSRQRQEILLQVARAIAFVRMRRVVPLAAVRDIAGPREPRDDAAVRRPRGEAADMVEVQMAREDNVDLVLADARFAKRMGSRW